MVGCFAADDKQMIILYNIQMIILYNIKKKEETALRAGGEGKPWHYNWRRSIWTGRCFMTI